MATIWINERPRYRVWAAWIGGALALAAVVLAWLGRSAPTPPVALAKVDTTAKLRPAPVPVERPGAVAAAAALPASAADLHCPHQTLEIATQSVAQQACVATTRVVQNGSIRTYVAHPEGVSTWTLTLDAAENQVISARLSQQGAGAAALHSAYACEDGACQGFSISRPDAHGVRTIAVRAARLKPAPDDRHALAVPPRLSTPASGAGSRSTAGSGTQQVASPTDNAVRLTATLLSVPERQIPELACTTTELSIVASDGGTSDFCASGGSGFAVADDGHRIFHFRNLEGQMLEVHLARDGQLLKVVFGELVCAGPTCSGVFVRAAGEADDPAVERSFTFSGTRLATPGRGALSVSLNGTLRMPSQE